MELSEREYTEGLETQLVDYTGCDPEIEKFLKRHGGKRGILCEVGDNREKVCIIAYRSHSYYPYIGVDGSFRYAKPVLEPRVKPLDEVLRLLADSYTFREGFWFDGEDGWELDFSECGSVPKYPNTWPDAFLDR